MNLKHFKSTSILYFLLSASSALAQYPIIPDTTKARGAKEDAEWQALSDKSWEKAVPTVMQGMLEGKPYVPQCTRPEDLKQAQIPAFPGADGGGMYSFGGRGINYLGAKVESNVFVVTSLADDGPGTLREACEAGVPRVIVFNVAGEIHLKRPINIRAPYITIAGQTAPGDGVVVTGETMEVDTHDVIIRFMRFRRGGMDVAHRDDACGGNGIGNIIYDHCSSSWGLDEVMSMYRHVYARHGGKQDKLPTVNITIQDCIFGQALDLYNHAFGASIGGHNTLFARNLFADNISRNPSVAMDGDFNFVNNVLFNWWNRSIDGGDEHSEFNIINNYFKPGPITGFDPKQDVDDYLKLYKKALKSKKPLSEFFQGSICYRILKPEASRDKNKNDQYGKAYVNGNYVDGFADVTTDNWKGGVQPGGIKGEENIKARLKVEEPFKYNAPSKLMTAQESYDYVLQSAGATIPRRDAIDELIIRGVKTGIPEYAKDAKVHTSPYSNRRLPADSYKLGIITDPQQVGGLTEYKGTPRTDTDGDGMPDAWEASHKLNPNDKADATQIGTTGYMNIELYINDLDWLRAL